jgi:hypothetical protein
MIVVPSGQIRKPLLPRIYFNSNRDGIVRIWKRPANGGQAVPVVKRQSYYAMESYDAATLYFLPSNAEAGIYQVPVAGGAERLVKGTESYTVRRHWEVAKDGIFWWLMSPHRSRSCLFDLRQVTWNSFAGSPNP